MSIRKTTILLRQAGRMGAQKDCLGPGNTPVAITSELMNANIYVYAADVYVSLQLG